MKQFCVTPVMGKRIIALGALQLPAIRNALDNGTLVIIAGTTNGYIAEDILNLLGQEEGFSRKGFRRGATLGPGHKLAKREFPGDVVIRDGQWLKGKTIFDVSDELGADDVILKGANAFDSSRQVAVQIGHSAGGTIHEALKAVYGRRATLIHPVGLEKRIPGNVMELARWVNATGASGPRLYPTPGELFTELDALKLLTGARCDMIAAGGIYGAEGSSWIAVEGTSGQEEAAQQLMDSVEGEAPCEV